MSNDQNTRRTRMGRWAEQLATDVANNVLRNQRAWLSDELPDLVINKIEQRLVDVLSKHSSLTTGALTSLVQDGAGKALSGASNQDVMLLVQSFIGEALQPTAAKLVERSRAELFKPIKQWYKTKHPNAAAQDNGAMFNAYMADVIHTAMQGQHTEDLTKQLVEIIRLLNAPRTLHGPAPVQCSRSI